ncbi:hypothetical protein [Cytobacillus sp. NCCP-133]|uniref:hypothetical protein n=1 Tax=Cytobacillus sp. NCCP-133 TaxID=766848 RepID=UPI002812F0D1|nr:hypothetical protein [Cytobacillus sp. NCCP-133]GLB60254.1 hypothetical protein NCCP133_23860 [Cytobacillus sp. NCCP-133]
MKQIINLDLEQLGFHERIQLVLSSYPVKMVQANGSLIVQQQQNPYFLINDIWSLTFLEGIPQFQVMVNKYKGTNRNNHFRIKNPSVNLEVKYVWYQKLFHEKWTLTTTFSGQVAFLGRLTEFLNERYPKLSSLLDIDIDNTEREWWFWLN